MSYQPRVLLMFYRPPSPTLDQQLQGCRPIPDTPVAEPQRGGVYFFSSVCCNALVESAIATYPAPVNLPL